METVEDHTSAARLFITEALTMDPLTMDPRMSHEKLMAAQAEAALAIASALDGVATAVRDGREA
ncbi:hypothetical protein OG417_24870 [Actinoallomurus sp. NBC_01490]|uniref:hypothetical protein n=1 Tax=Actinoallomurus sp. NBC_01490 TaxID=2903557 RepID=UPI002E324D99|nr:hypothetical protein [Actinoallomurus sp. NBC_01490]